VHSAYKNLLGIRPAEGGLASWLGKADVMKPHSAYGFPAGRAQLWKLLGEGTDKFFRKASPQALSKKIGVDIFDSFEALEKSTEPSSLSEHVAVLLPVLARVLFVSVSCHTTDSCGG